MPANIDNFLGINEAALTLRSKRSELLAANLANADTPNYKAQDIDFQSLLSECQNPRDAAALETTRSNHIGGDNALANPSPMYRTPMQPAVDGNTVDTEVEKAAFMENSLQYQATLRFIDGSIKTLRTAIRGD